MVGIYGYIRRDHIMRKFRVSRPQASLDLLQARIRGYVVYDVSAKRYIAWPLTEEAEGRSLPSA